MVINLLCYDKYPRDEKQKNLIGSTTTLDIFTGKKSGVVV